MSIKQLAFKNIQKNVKNYSLYIFSLTFSVALYFAFATLQYDAAMDEMGEMVNGAAMIRAASFGLMIIVTIFLLYANNLFMKRRGKEFGLFQLMGMTKGEIFRILSTENLILYVSSLLIGIFLGFSVSKLFVMILFKMTNIDVIITLHFSLTALLQTIFVFSLIYFIMLLLNYLFMRRQSILSLFQASATREEKNHHVSLLTIIIGLLGICFIFFGYFLSSKLFGGDFAGNRLFYAMITILCSVMFGTYLFYKGSVSFLFYLLRKNQDGYMPLNSVLSVAVMMFRMRSNALLLTIITLISALTISLSSLAYISYHSAEKVAEQMVPHHFSVFNETDMKDFHAMLEDKKITFTTEKMDVLKFNVDVTQALETGSYDNLDIRDDPSLQLVVISDQATKKLDVSANEAVLTEPADALEEMLSFKEAGKVTIIGEQEETKLTYQGMESSSMLPHRLTNGFPVVIVNNEVFEHLKKDSDLPIQNEFPLYIGVNIQDDSNLEEANDIFHALNLNKWTGKWTGFESQLEISTYQKQGMGLNIFIAGFLGLTFLVTSGCILYFKQMDESEEEKESYTILRKLGFTEEDLLHGICIKQLINFGIPLLIGLLHSYFAVKSGWFIFGTEMWTPMLIVMFIYTVLYSIFGFLSVQYYRQVVKVAL